MFRVLQAAPLSLIATVMASGDALARAPRPCLTRLCAAPAPDLGAGAPAIAAVVLSLGIAAWMTARTRRAAARRS